MKKPMSKALKNFFGFGDFMTDLGLSFRTYYWTFFLTSVAKLPLATVALIAGTIATFEMFASPFFGVVIDAVKPMKWGRYRSFLLIMPPIIAVLYGVQWFLAGKATVAGIAILLVVIGILYSLAFNTMYISNLAIIPVVSSNESDRAHLSSRRWAWINLSKVVLGYLVTFMLGIFAFGGEVGVQTYAISALIFGLLPMIGYWSHFKMTKGYEGRDAEEAGTAPKTEPIKFKALLDSLIKNPPLLAIFVASIFTALTSFTLAMMGAYQFNMVLGAPAMFAAYMAITNFGAVVGSLLAGVLSKKFDTKKLSMIALPLMVVGLFAARMLYLSVWGFTLSVLVVQFLASFNYPLFVTMYSNCAVYSEWKTGKKANALVMGISGVPVKIAILIVGVMIPAILAAAGYNADAAITDAVKTGIANGITLVPMACYTLAFLTITFGFKLTREKLNQLQKEIDERNQAA